MASRHFDEIIAYLDSATGVAAGADGGALALKMVPTLEISGHASPILGFNGGQITAPRHLHPDLNGVISRYQQKLNAWRQGNRNPFFVDDGDLVMIYPNRGLDEGHLIVLRQTTLADILQAAFPDTVLPSALMRLLVEIAAGVQLKNDGNANLRSSETRKSQARDLRGRLGVGSTGELSRIISATVTRAVATAIERQNRADNEPFFRHMETYYPPGAQPIILATRQGVRHRIVAMGPADGRPVIVLHPLILPAITDEDLQWLVENRMRLYWPLRLGQLAPQEGPQSEAATIDHALEGIDLVRRSFCGPMVPIVSIAAASKIALCYARRHPDRVALLCFAASCVLKDRPEGGARRLAKVMLRVLDNTPWLADGALRLLANQMLSERTFRTYIPKHFADSPADSTLVATELAQDSGSERMRTALKLSLNSIRHDFGFQLDLAWDQARNLDVPMHMVHGLQDCVHPIHLIRTLAAGLPRITLHELPDAGQLLSGPALRATLQKVGAIIGQRDRGPAATAFAP